MRKHYTKIHQLIGEDSDEDLLLEEANAKAKQQSSTQKRGRRSDSSRCNQNEQAETEVMPTHFTQRIVGVVKYFVRLQNFVFPLVVKIENEDFTGKCTK